MSAIKDMISRSEKKISIAIIGLDNSGKSAFIKKIAQFEETMYTTVANESDIQYYTLRNLSLISWELKDFIPQNKALWKRSIMGADALLFFVDSTDKDKLNLNRKLLFELVSKNFPIKLLVLASKSDLLDSCSLTDIFDGLDIVNLDRTKCSCDLFKFSSQTGEGIYAISEWMNKTLFKQKEKIVDFVEIQTCAILNEPTDEIIDAVLVENPDITLLSTYREIRRKARVFARTMRLHGKGEEVIEINNFKVLFIKEGPNIIAVLIRFNDSIPRTIEITKNILHIATSYQNQDFNLKKLIQDLYPMDVQRMKYS
ncbi:MAG: ADP-ribosylation factor-like protein [Candidatus Heimdallarchaeota archaeon]